MRDHEGDDGSAEGPTTISGRRAKKFFRHLAEHPFMCVVDTGDGLTIYSKEMDPEDVTRIKTVLEEEDSDE